MSLYEDKKYNSFDDFFSRKIKEDKRIYNNKKNDLISVCDAKLFVSKINENLNLKTVTIQLKNYSKMICLQKNLIMVHV